MYGIKWFKGANYYQVRGYLQKNGFKRTDDYGYYDKGPTKGWVVFDDGVEKIRLECTLKRNEKGDLICDKVYAFQTQIYDNLKVNNQQKYLLEDTIQRALIIDPNNDVSVKFHNKEISNEFFPYEYRTIDMGTGVLWCEYNLGAFPGNKPKDWYGDYYAWGETETKDIYSWETYGHCEGTKDTITKYNKIDGLKYLEPNDDVITETLCKTYRMPTYEEYQKLVKNTTNEYVKNYKDIDGLNGILFTAKNGNTLFFPASGYYDQASLYSTGRGSCLWSASLFSNQNAFNLSFYSDAIYPSDNYYRYYGFTIRGVMEQS